MAPFVMPAASAMSAMEALTNPRWAKRRNAAETISSQVAALCSDLVALITILNGRYVRPQPGFLSSLTKSLEQTPSNKTLFTSADGKTEERELKAGQAVRSDAVTHSVENTGTGEDHGLVIELKK